MEESMLKNGKLRIVLALLICVVVLSSCLNRTPASPTPDVNMIYTQAAETLAVQLTGTAAAMPTATFTVAPTETQAPTATLASTLPLGTAQPLVTLPGVATATLAAPKAPDAAAWVEQTPADGFQMNPGQSFDIVWKLKNTGTTTWTTNYQYRYFSGAKLHENKNTYNLKSAVAPNDEALLVVDGIAPMTAGEYTTTWVITNEAGTNFYAFTLTIKVGSVTATPFDIDAYCCQSEGVPDPARKNDSTCTTYWNADKSGTPEPGKGNTCPAGVK